MEIRHNDRRIAQAAATKAAVVEASRQLFLSRGYVATTVGAVAEQAGVAIQTIYNSVGNKAALLSAVVDATAAGPDASRSVPEIMRERTAAAADADAVIALLADWFAEVHPRSSELFSVMRQASAVDPEVAEVLRDRAELRLRNYAEAAAALRKRGVLTSGMSDEQAAAVIWSVGHPDTYRSLVLDFGWEPERYRDWVHAALKAALA
ncbi:TetR/AcrR family transcriptional regulator [Paenarthrobacter sp. 2TAF44]|uniref:TetR/AcrR family transcriptional regulator n=1 Tax=Paenarthrobacter sp. 2TAF44 TaxID=3233018 RepID=UPI003F9DB7A1